MTTTPHVWKLIQRWMDGQVLRVNQSQFADALGVRRQTVSQWKSGEVRPSPPNLRQISRVTRIPFGDLTAALLLDLGYTEEMTDAPSTSRAAVSAAPEPEPPAGYDLAADTNPNPPRAYDDQSER